MLRKLVAKCAPNACKTSGVSFRASNEGCTKLPQICRKLEDQFRTILCKYPFSNAPISEFLSFLTPPRQRQHINNCAPPPVPATMLKSSLTYVCTCAFHPKLCGKSHSISLQFPGIFVAKVMLGKICRPSLRAICQRHPLESFQTSKTTGPLLTRLSERW